MGYDRNWIVARTSGLDLIVSGQNMYITVEALRLEGFEYLGNESSSRSFNNIGDLIIVILFAH